MSEKLLDVQNLTIHYTTLSGPVRAAEDITISLEEGHTLGLAGESGCGKTTTGLALLKLLPSNGRILKGKVIFEGRDLLKLDEETFRKEIRWKKISMIFQGAMNALHPTKTVGDQIAEAIITHEDVERKEALERAGKLLDLVGVGKERLGRYPHELSGGMKQRSVIAMALACNPRMVIADEPTTALDVIIQAQVMKVIKELQEKLKLSMIIISHDLSLIAETSTEVAIMYAGKIVEYGNTTSVYKEPLHPYTEKLIGAFPSIIGPKRELSTIHGFPPDLINPPPGCRFHPRCPYAQEKCKKEEPSLEEKGKKHFVACHLV
uniref:ABC transporter ATP-binding protein n=1 Tax=Fervidobacterium pennivorans TaxID=93466 RepID=A0A7C4VV24_FERPE